MQLSCSCLSRGAEEAPAIDRNESRARRHMVLTCRPAFAECDFCLCVGASLGPAFPPVDFPLPPAISRAISFESLDGIEDSYAIPVEYR